MTHCAECDGRPLDDEGFCEHCDALMRYADAEDKARRTGFNFLRLIKWLAGFSVLFAVSGFVLNSLTSPNIVKTEIISFCLGLFGSICIEYSFFKVKGIEPSRILNVIASGWARQLVETRRIAKGVERHLEKTSEETTELEGRLQKLSDVEHIRGIDLLVEKNELLLRRLEEVAEYYKEYVEPSRRYLQPVLNGIDSISQPSSSSNFNRGTVVTIAANLLGEMGSTLYTRHRFERVEKKLDRVIGAIVLESIPGVGKGKAQELLGRFGSVEKIANAPVEELASVKGITAELAKRIKAHLTRLLSDANIIDGQKK